MHAVLVLLAYLLLLSWLLDKFLGESTIVHSICLSAFNLLESGFHGHLSHASSIRYLDVLRIEIVDKRLLYHIV